VAHALDRVPRGFTRRCLGSWPGEPPYPELTLSSGQVDEHSNQGINDRLVIDLQNISGPAPGKSYYAWLLGDRAQTLAAPILLGKLPVTNGGVHFLYPGDIHHTNLIAITSRFLITEEDANTTPSIPSPDQSTWRYFAELPQTPDTMDMMHEGALQHFVTCSPMRRNS
jgi:hypothetical protein